MVQELSYEQLLDLADAGANIHVHLPGTLPNGNGGDPPDDPDPPDPSTPVLLYDQPGGNQAAPVYETFVKGNGKLEPGEKIIGTVGHGNQVILLAFPDNMASTFVKADWWYLFVVGPSVTGWVHKKDGRSVIEA